MWRSAVSVRSVLGRRALQAMCVLAGGALVLTGCSNSEDDSPAVAKVQGIDKFDTAAALLPDKIKQSGKLVVGVNIPYQPNEYKDPSGKIVGFDVDLMDAVAATLGLKAEYLESSFEKII